MTTTHTATDLETILDHIRQQLDTTLRIHCEIVDSDDATDTIVVWTGQGDWQHVDTRITIGDVPHDVTDELRDWLS